MIRILQRAARAGALAAGHLVGLGAAAFNLGRNLLQLLDRVGRGRVRRARHRVRGLAAGRDAGPRQVLRGAAPVHDDLVPRHREVHRPVADPVLEEPGDQPVLQLAVPEAEDRAPSGGLPGGPPRVPPDPSHHRVDVELAPRDRIDVQSFIWVVGAYDEAVDKPAS